MSEQRIPLAVPNVGAAEQTNLAQCIESGWVSSAGPFVDSFESALASYVGSEFAVSTMNGTAAIHLALIASGVEAGTEVAMPSLTFIAPANAVRYTGAWPTFIDVEPHHWQLSVESLTRFLEDQCHSSGAAVVNSSTGRRVSAVMPVDILGHPCDLGAIRDLARRFGLAVVEDATESLGARWHGTRLGPVSPITCFSFNGNKLITTGGGGMICTDDARIADLTRHLSTQARIDGTDYIHDQVGYNYRLTNIQAAVGVAQLGRIGEFLTRKRQIADAYQQELGDLVTFQSEAEWAEHAWWLTTILLPPGRDPSGLVAFLDDRDIEARRIWEPMHISKAMDGCWSEPCPVTDEIRARAVSIPSSTSMTDTELSRVIAAVREALT